MTRRFPCEPKTCGFGRKETKGLRRPDLAVCESLRFACLRQNPRKTKQNWPLQRPSYQFAILWWRRERNCNPTFSEFVRTNSLEGGKPGCNSGDVSRSPEAMLFNTHIPSQEGERSDRGC